jgi:hypothetical protein
MTQILVSTGLWRRPVFGDLARKPPGPSHKDRGARRAPSALAPGQQAACSACKAAWLVRPLVCAVGRIADSLRDRGLAPGAAAAERALRRLRGCSRSRGTCLPASGYCSACRRRGRTWRGTFTRRLDGLRKNHSSRFLGVLNVDDDDKADGQPGNVIACCTVRQPSIQLPFRTAV